MLGKGVMFFSKEGKTIFGIFLSYIILSAILLVMACVITKKEPSQREEMEDKRQSFIIKFVFVGLGCLWFIVGITLVITTTTCAL